MAPTNAAKKVQCNQEHEYIYLICFQDLMGIACNTTWQESDPDACLRVRTGGRGSSQLAINVIKHPLPMQLDGEVVYTMYIVHIVKFLSLNKSFYQLKVEAATRINFITVRTILM